ncbi:hypothetical protein LH89_22310 [Dickeya fangzhongdai]|nr:hypothetical protein LH89_22310 [Dickeya fangzhongdai]
MEPSGDHATGLHAAACLLGIDLGDDADTNQVTQRALDFGEIFVCIHGGKHASSRGMRQFAVVVWRMAPPIFASRLSHRDKPQ